MDGPQIGRELPVFVSHYANYLSRFLLCVVCTHLTGQVGAGAETSSLGNIVFTSASAPTPHPSFYFAHTGCGLLASCVWWHSLRASGE